MTPNVTCPMYLVHNTFGKRLSWSLFEQNLLLADGWREVNAQEYRVPDRDLVRRFSSTHRGST